MKLYLAHNFAARDALRLLVEKLEASGYHVTSRWITDDAHVQESTAQQNALDDLEDIDAADVLVLFVDQFKDRPGKGKFIEFGYAYAKGKQIILCGDDTESSVFYKLPGVVCCWLKDLIPTLYRMEQVELQALKSAK